MVDRGWSLKVDRICEKVFHNCRKCDLVGGNLPMDHNNSRGVRAAVITPTATLTYSAHNLLSLCHVLFRIMLGHA